LVLCIPIPMDPQQSPQQKGAYPWIHSKSPPVFDPFLHPSMFLSQNDSSSDVSFTERQNDFSSEGQGQNVSTPLYPQFQEFNIPAAGGTGNPGTVSALPFPLPSSLSPDSSATQNELGVDDYSVDGSYGVVPVSVSSSSAVYPPSLKTPELTTLDPPPQEVGVTTCSVASGTGNPVPSPQTECRRKRNSRKSNRKRKALKTRASRPSTERKDEGTQDEDPDDGAEPMLKEFAKSISSQSIEDLVIKDNQSIYLAEGSCRFLATRDVLVAGTLDAETGDACFSGCVSSSGREILTRLPLAEEFVKIKDVFPRDTREVRLGVCALSPEERGFALCFLLEGRWFPIIFFCVQDDNINILKYGQGCDWLFHGGIPKPTQVLEFSSRTQENACDSLMLGQAVVSAKKFLTRRKAVFFKSELVSVRLVELGVKELPSEVTQCACCRMKSQKKGPYKETPYVLLYQTKQGGDKCFIHSAFNFQKKSVSVYDGDFNRALDTIIHGSERDWAEKGKGYKQTISLSSAPVPFCDNIVKSFKHFVTSFSLSAPSVKTAVIEEIRNEGSLVELFVNNVLPFLSQPGSAQYGPPAKKAKWG